MSLGTVMSFVLPMCILISCSYVLFVLIAFGMFMFVKVMSSLISVMSPPPCLCPLSVRMVCNGVFWCFSFLCEFCFLHCDDLRLDVVYEFFGSSINF